MEAEGWDAAETEDWDVAGGEQFEGASYACINNSALHLGNYLAVPLPQWGAVVCCAPGWATACDKPVHKFDVSRLQQTKYGLSLVHELVQFVRHHAVSGPILFHCKAGRHRAAASMAMLLIVAFNISADEAIHIVETSRPEADIRGSLRNKVRWVACQPRLRH